MLTLSRWARFYRLKDWPHLLGLVLVGYASASGPHVPLRLGLALLTGCLYLSHGYSINDIYDGQVRIAIPRGRALSLSLAALLLSLVTASFVSFAALVAVAAAHLSGMFYSVRPFRLKNKLFLDLVFNALSLAPLALLGASARHTPDARSFGLFGLVFLYFIPVQLIHEIQDRDVDRTLQPSNTYQRLGPRRSRDLTLAALLTYGAANIVLGKIGLLGTFSFSLGVAFAVILSTLLMTPLSKNNIKLKTRTVSIIYGLGLVLTLSLSL